MILRSRRWRLAIKALTLLVTSVLMLGFAGPVSYALQDDTPRPITGLPELRSKEKPVANAYATARGVPDFAHTFTSREGDTLYYWIPIQGYSNQLFVRTEDPNYVFPHDSVSGRNAPTPQFYAGKVATLEGQANTEEIREELANLGITIDKEAEEKAIVVLQGEVPSAYRPIVPVIPVLAWLWLAALIGVVQIWRGKRVRRDLAQAVLPARNAR